MASLLIRGTRLKEAKLYCSNSGQLAVDFTCRASWTDTVCEQMGWTKTPEGFCNGGLEGDLAAVNMMMEPNNSNLKDYRFDLKISSVHTFKHKAKTEEGEITKRELEFVVTTSDPQAPAVLALYLEKCGPGDDAGQAKIVYTTEEEEDAKQAVIPGTEEIAGKRGKGKEAVQ